MSERIRPDTFYPLNIDGGDRQYVINAKYDRLDVFPWLGHYVLKVYDDEQGLVSMHLDKPTAQIVAYRTEIPIVEREFIYQSEYNGYLEAVDKMMEHWTE